MLDWIIHGGTIVDGTRGPRYVGDIGIAGDRIVAIGNLRDTAAQQRFNAAGLVVAPGFVDVHTHSDGHMLQMPGLEPKISQGFTTEVLMLDGISYAPVDERTWRQWFFYLRALDALPLDAYRGWRSIADFMRHLDRKSLQNSVALIPYANLRSLVSGFGSGRLDDLHRQSIRRLIGEEMAAGAVGLSTGLDYIVQCHATTDDLVDACQAMASSGGVYVTHVRYKQGLLRALEEAVDIGRRAGVAVHISHLKAGDAAQVEPIMELLERARHQVDLSFDVYPYQSGSTMLNYLLPYEVWEDGPLAAIGKLNSPNIRAKFALALDSYRLRLGELRIAWLLSAENKHLQGKTLAEVIQLRGGRAEDVLCDLLIEERLAVLLILQEPEGELVHPFLQHDLYMMGSDGIYFAGGHIHPRMFGSATRVIGPLVRDYQLFSLEEAIYKLSAFPAARFGLRDRGTIVQGALADLVAFDPQSVTDRATFDDPQASSTGIRLVMVNGHQVWNGTKLLGDVLPGRWLVRQ